jgi:DNA repair protein RadD
LILDYAGNNAVHFPDGDIFNPKIRAKASSESETLVAICPECNHQNDFAIRPNDAGYTITDHGYFSWPDNGEVVLDSEKRPVPAHFGRRCKGLVNRVDRCNYYWSHKVCTNESCLEKFDIAARYCPKCKTEIIDPNEKLELERQEKENKIKESPLTEPILHIRISEDFNGDKRVKVINVETIFRKRINVFLRVSDEKQREQYRYYRDNKVKIENMNVKFFRPIGSKYYKFVELQ